MNLLVILVVCIASSIAAPVDDVAVRQVGTLKLSFLAKSNSLYLLGYTREGDWNDGRQRWLDEHDQVYDEELVTRVSRNKYEPAKLNVGFAFEVAGGLEHTLLLINVNLSQERYQCRWNRI